MKVSAILSLTALSATATAWSVQFHTRSNIGWNVKGTKDASCNTLNWPSGKAKEDVEYIKYVTGIFTALGWGWAFGCASLC
jgi:hypothetical protein